MLAGYIRFVSFFPYRICPVSPSIKTAASLSRSNVVISCADTDADAIKKKTIVIKNSSCLYNEHHPLFHRIPLLYGTIFVYEFQNVIKTVTIFRFKIYQTGEIYFILFIGKKFRVNLYERSIKIRFHFLLIEVVSCESFFQSSMAHGQCY